jgi:hypothetical protein
LKEARSQGEEIKMEGGPQKSSTNKRKKQKLGLKKTAGDPEVDTHSRDECWENYYPTRKKDDWIQIF